MADENKLKILNMALKNLGQAPITSVNENSDRARKISSFYDDALKETCRQYQAGVPPIITTLEASEDYESPLKEYPYAYKYPQDATVVIKVFREGQYTDPDSLKFNLKKVVLDDSSKKVLLSNVENAMVEYIAYQAGKEELFDDIFISAAAYQLAFLAAIVITGDANKQANMLALFTDKIAQAAAVSSNEQNLSSGFISDYEKARYE